MLPEMVRLCYCMMTASRFKTATHVQIHRTVSDQEICRSQKDRGDSYITFEVIRRFCCQRLAGMKRSARATEADALGRAEE